MTSRRRALLYQPDRLLVSVGDAPEIPDGQTVIPWPDDVTAAQYIGPYMGGLYLEGNEALKFITQRENLFWIFQL